MSQSTPGVSESRATTLLAECDAFIAEHKAKADRHKQRAKRSVWFISGSTAAIPVLIVASTATSEFVLGQLLPGILAAVTAMASAWTGANRPHERWVLYRRFQRLAESERLRFTQGCAPYGASDAPQRFAEWLAVAKSAVHSEWSTLLPSATEVQAAGAAPEGAPPA